jgi:hypothetical protein
MIANKCFGMMRAIRPESGEEPNGFFDLFKDSKDPKQEKSA